MYDGVVESAGDWQPHQIRYAVAWSELDRDQAQRMFNGTVPTDRVFGIASESTVRIVRSSIMLGLGQRINPRTSQHDIHPLAWEGDAEKYGYGPLNREIFPVVAEYKRAHSHPAPLPGNLGHVFTPLLGLVRAECLVRGVSLQQCGVFGEVLSPTKGRHFSRAFGGVPWTPILSELFQTNPSAALLQCQTAPTRPAAADAGRTLLFAPLSVLAGRLLATGISSRDGQIVMDSVGQLSLGNAREIQERFQEETFGSVLVEGQETPLFLIRNTLAQNIAVAQHLQRLGLEDDTSANQVIRRLSEWPLSHPNTFTENWIQIGYPIFERAGTRVDGIDPAALEKNPGHWLGRVLLTLLEQEVRKYHNRDPIFAVNLAEYFEQTHKAIPESTEGILDLFPLFVSSSDPKLSQALEKQGGKTQSVPLAAIPELRLEQGTYRTNVGSNRTGTITEFNSDSLRALRTRYPEGALPTRCTNHLVQLAKLTLAAQY